MNFNTWAQSVPLEITGDVLWKLEAYRLALFAADLAWSDTTKLAADRRTLDLASQLYRAVGSIEANISEGYSRGGGRDRARFYEYALGSARESRGWYYKGRHLLNSAVTRHRMGLITQITKLLLPMVRNQRTSPGFLHEARSAYYSNADLTVEMKAQRGGDLTELLDNVPSA